jgi:hypothetical protein
MDDMSSFDIWAWAAADAASSANARGCKTFID